MTGNVCLRFIDSPSPAIQVEALPILPTANHQVLVVISRLLNPLLASSGEAIPIGVGELTA
jgi:hypothetical protein